MKEFLLEQFLEPLMEDDSYFTKKMFGGLAIYYNGLMVLILTEKPGDRDWKGGKFSFDIWNGVLVATSREHHESLKKDFSALINHPLIEKWQYLPMADSKFEEQFDQLVELVMNNDTRVGIVPGAKKKKRKRKSKTASKKTKKRRSNSNSATKKKVKVSKLT